MAQQVGDLDKLAEAQEAADAAVEAATLAAEKVAEVSSGNDLTAGQVADLDKPAKTQEANGGGMADGYGIIRKRPEDFSVEGVFCKGDGSQIFSAANGFASEAAARQWVWVYDQLAEDPDGRPAHPD